MSRSQKIKIYFLVGIVLISLFISNKDINYCFYIKTCPEYLYIPIFTISILFYLFSRKIYLDIITFILFARLILYILPIIYINNREGYWGNYFSVIASFVAYFIASQPHNNTNFLFSKKVNKILAVYLVLIAIQVMYVFLSLFLKNGLLNINLLKFYMITPVGASNYITSISVPLLIFICYSDLKKGSKLYIALLVISSLFMIQSKNALFVLVILVSIRFIKDFFRKIITPTPDANLRKVIIFIVISTTLFIVFITYKVLMYFTLSWNMGMIPISTSSLYDTINALTSNRLFVYLKEITRWMDHILLGNGLAYELGYARSHNWAIELLVQSGIIGFVMFVFSIIWWFLKIYKFRLSNRFINSSIVCVIAMLFQGMAEISLFTVSLDVLFWYFIGASIAEANFKNKIDRLKVENTKNGK